jgi:hypothetical protein
MAIRLFETCHGRTREQEVLENAVLDDSYRLSRDALIVVGVLPVQVNSS